MKLGFIPPAVAFSLLDYLLAYETIVNLNFRFERIKAFSQKAVITIREEYGVPEPFDKVVFATFTLIAMIIA